MKESIQSSDLLKKAANLIFKGIVSALNYEIEDLNEDGKLKEQITVPLMNEQPSGDVEGPRNLRIKLSPIKDQPHQYVVDFDLTDLGGWATAYNKSGKVQEIKNSQDMENIITEFVDHFELKRKSDYDEEQEEESESSEGSEHAESTEASPETTSGSESTEASRHFDVTLQRVTCNQETTINLTAIRASYDINEAMNDLNLLLDNEDFRAQITEEPVAFAVIDTGDDFDVEPTEVFEEVSGVYSALFKIVTNALNNLVAIKWAVVGKDSADYSQYANTTWSLSGMQEGLAELTNVYEHSFVHPGDLQEYENRIDVSSGFHFDEAISATRDIVKNVIDKLDAYYVNVPHEVQRTFDAWLSDLKQQYSQLTKVSM